MNNTNNIDYVPFPCEIVSVQDLTALEKLFRFKRTDGKPFGQKPGQFMQLSIPGIGEAPISVSSSPTRGDYLEMGIRRTGVLTDKIHTLQAGEQIGMRGPFGTYFPAEELKGKDLILVAGGCGLAPLRSLIQYVEDKHSDFGKITVLYGAKSPADLMYKEEIEEWKKSKVLSFNVTVDMAQPESGWRGNVGLITTLIPALSIDVNNTVAVICGPPIMYKFVIVELKKKGLTEKNIVVSLERHMKCGVGKCGHCTIDHFYCCIDGPVFWLDKVVGVRDAI